MVEVLCPTSESRTHLCEIDKKSGLEYFTAAMKMQAQASDKKSPIGSFNGAYQVVTLEAGHLWMGYIYARNNSSEKFNLGIKPDLEGCQVVSHKPDVEGFIDMKMNPGQDDIIMIKRFDGACRFGMASRISA